MSSEIRKSKAQEITVIIVYQPVYHTESWEGKLYVDLECLQSGEYEFELDDEYIEIIKRQGFIAGRISRTDENARALAWRLPQASDSFYRSTSLSEWIDGKSDDNNPMQITYYNDVSDEDEFDCGSFGESGFEDFYDKDGNVVIPGESVGDGFGIDLLDSLNEIDGIKFIVNENGYLSYDYCENDYDNVVLRFESNGVLIEEEYTTLQSAVNRIKLLLGDIKRENYFVTLSGKTVAITGKFKQYTRAEVEELVKAMGGRLTSSVSSKTDVLIYGDKTGSKLDKALELGIQVLSEDTFYEFIKK